MVPWHLATKLWAYLLHRVQTEIPVAEKLKFFSIKYRATFYTKKIYAVLEEKTANHLLSRYKMHLRNSARDETNHDISLFEIIKYVASVWLNSKKKFPVLLFQVLL